MAFDLHMHSGVSADGEYTNEQLLDFAMKAGLDTIALTDHNSTQGVLDMIEKGRQRGIQVIPGIECDTLLEENSVHLLGYGIDPEDPYFKALPSTINKLSSDAFHERVLRLVNKYGIDVDEEAILKEAGDKNPWFILMRTIFADPRAEEIEDFKDYLPGGSRSDPAPVNFFWDKCGPGSDLHVHVEYPDFREAVKRIHESGGIAIVAHPFKTFYHNEALLKEAMDAGIEGIEAYSNYHDDEMCEYYRDFAEKNSLLISCGSDFHGHNKPSIVMGEYHLQHDGTPYLEAILKKLEETRA